MKEFDYIRTKNIAHLEIAREALARILSHVDPVIENEKLQQMREQINFWLEKLYETTEVKE